MYRVLKSLMFTYMVFAFSSIQAQIFKKKQKQKVGVGTVQLSNALIDSIMENMVWVRGGKFTMGSALGAIDEKPEKVVTIDGFSISRYPVTQAQWKAVMGVNPSSRACDDCPVDNVSWLEAQQFIQFLNGVTGKKFTLPTEAEWEYAAAGGLKSNRFRFSGSDRADEVGWFAGNTRQSQPVGQKAPNELGLYDMTGNVWEWCQDYYAAGYYDELEFNNPTGPTIGTSRVRRGGSWYTPENNCRVTTRNSVGEDYKDGNGGLRLALYPN